MWGEILTSLDGAVVLLYGITWLGYARSFGLGRQAPTKSTIVPLLTALIAHTAVLIVRGIHLGHTPTIGMHGALGFVAWSMALCYVFLQTHLRTSAFGIFILPFAVVFTAIVWLVGGPTDSTDLAAKMSERGALFALHMAGALFSYSCFAIAFAGGLMYVLLDRELHSKKIGALTRRMPPLAKIDKVVTHSVGLGLIMLGLGMVLGVIGLAGQPEGWESWEDNAKVFTALLIWMAYAFILFMMIRGDWRGRRGALGAVVCFLMVFALYFVVNLMFANLHGAV